MIKWLEKNVIGITIWSFLAGGLVAFINIVADYLPFVYLYLSFFGIAAIGTVLQMIWAWIVNPIREYRKNKRK